MTNHPLEFLAKEYLSEKDITHESYDLYNTILKQYINYLENKHILYASTQDVCDYINQLKQGGYSDAWIYNQISVIKGLYHYLSTHQQRLALPKIYIDDVTESIQNIHVKKAIKKPVLSIKQARQLLLCTKRNRKYIWHYRDHAMISLMITTGMRSVEIRRARKTDIQQVNHHTLLYIQGKGKTSKDDVVKVTPGVKKAIDEYLKRRKDHNPYLFISHSRKSDVPYLSRTFFIRMFRRVLKACDLEYTHITPHSLRHTAATLNLKRGASLEDTKQLMRHTNISSTLLYTHQNPRTQDNTEEHLENYILKEDNEGYRSGVIIIDL